MPLTRLADHSVLTAFEEVLAGLPRAINSTAIRDNTALLGRWANPAALRALLQQIVQSEELTAAVATRSYRHINHFDKIVLVGDNTVDGYRLTLHLWSPPYTDREMCEEMIHDHRFKFWSAIVAGELRSENFAEGGEGEPYQKYQYTPEIRDTSFNDFYRFVGDTHLSRTPAGVHHAGDIYFLDAAIHRVVLPTEQLTCTLVLRGPRHRSYANVYNTAYPTENTSFDNRMFTHDELQSRLNSVISAMDARKASSGVAK